MQHDEVARALVSRFAIIQVMGPHAGESSEGIIRRKTEDISRRQANYTLWAQHSYLAKPHHVVSLCQRARLKNEDVYFYIVDNSGEAPGGYACAATHYRPEGSENWQPIRSLGIGPVTENARLLKSGKAYALAIGELHSLESSTHKISMADWADATRDELWQARTGRGHPVVCAERRDMRSHNDVWLKERKIIAVARMVQPYAVWLKADT